MFNIGNGMFYTDGAGKILEEGYRKTWTFILTLNNV